MTKLKIIETMPKHAGTTWTKTTVYEGRRPLFVHIWANNIITTRLTSDLPAGDDQEKKSSKPS